jgi:hypothetical protein
MRTAARTISLSFLSLTLGLVACGGAAELRPASPPQPQPSASAGEGGATTPPPAGDPFALGAPMPDEPPPADSPPPDLTAWAAARSVAGVGAPPATCDAFAQRRVAAKAALCAERAPALAALDTALLEVDAAKRDASLVGIESCAGLPPGLVRALRAELAPVECGDKIVDATIAQRPSGLSGSVLGTLVAQSLAARLARTVAKPPAFAPPYDKAHVLAYVKGPLKAWIEAQALAIEAISRSGAKLEGYAKGVVAVEAGLADLRFVERARAVPVPTEFEKDPELKEMYVVSLEQTLDPRKDRGRDAALIGLRELASVGVVHDARVDKARSLLGKLYAGRRIDALDALLLPDLPPLAQLTLEERLAAKLPTFYANALLDEATVVQPAIVRALLVQGVPSSLRVAGAKPVHEGSLGPEARATYARGRIELGRTYWRAVDFDQTARMESARRKEGEEATFLLALSIALRSGPKDAIEMMRAPSPAALEIRNVAALDTIKQGKYAGMAAFDAALLLATAPPEKAAHAYFNDVAKRFHAAALLLSGAEKGVAEERARNAEGVAAIASSAPPPLK